MADRIDSTTLMVNMQCAEDAVLLANEHKFSGKVGLHLNLAEGIPLSNLISKTDLCTDGRFNGTHEKMSYRFYIKRSLRRAIQAELDLQFKQFYLYFNHYPDFVDSHGHFHNFIPYYLIVRKLAKKYGVKRMRIGINLYDKRNAGLLKRLYKLILNSLIKREFVHTDYMGSWLEYKNYFNSLHPKSNSTVEIMTHPSFHNGALVDVVFENGRCFTNFTEIEKNV